jgi:hypothetical protein
MHPNENAPFLRGETYYGGLTIDTNNLGDGKVLEGKEYHFPDVNPVTGAYNSGRTVKCRIVRNRSGIALLPGRVVSYALTAAGYATGLAVDGYTTVTAGRPAGVVDEYLPTAGVPNGDLFFIVIEGPTSIRSSLSGNATNVFAVGDVAVALTAATSQATTAGRIAPQDLTGATAPLANQVQNALGYAMSAATTANTNQLVRFDLMRLN